MPAIATRFVVRTLLHAACLLIGGLLVAGAVGGCQKQLFPEDEPRSQYDRFDTVRDRRAPRRLENALGEMKINLRGRLLSGPE